MAGFLKNRAGTVFDNNAAAKLSPSLGPVGTSGFDSDNLQKNIGMGSPGYTKPIGSALGGASDLSGLGCADAADFQATRVDNHTRSPMSQTYFKRSN